MTGCIFKRRLPSGRVTWGYSIDVGKDANGKRLQDFKSGFAKKGEAEDALRVKLNEKDAGELVKPDPTSFGVFLATWFTEYAERQCSLKTVERYRELAAYIVPHIGLVKFQDLTALSLERIFNHLKDAGGRDRKTKQPRPLSAKTVHHIAGVVNVALETAIRWKLLKVNPMNGVELPKVEKNRKGKALETGQLAWYLDAARAAGLFEIVMVASATGCRRGELLAFAWPDVDVVRRSLSISKSLEQTKAGLRVKLTKNEEPRLLSLPASVVPVLQTLRESQNENRRMFGPDYRTDLNLVFCDPQGNHLKPDSVTSKACLIAQKAGLKNTSLHTLRHSHGSQLLSAGVSLPTVSKRLGHSSVDVTATVYSHALAKDEQAAADLWDSSVHAAIERESKGKVS